MSFIEFIKGVGEKRKNARVVEYFIFFSRQGPYDKSLN